MQQLLSIETVPISVEYKVNKATSVPSEQSATISLSSGNGKYAVKSNPVQIRMDQFERPVNLSYKATVQYSEDGSVQLDIKLSGDPIDDLAYQRQQRSMDTMIQQLPSSESDNPVKAMRINFETSGLPADWGIFPRPNVRFIPGNLEVKVKEFPKVIIKYVGGPIYVPRSSDPNYEASV